MTSNLKTSVYAHPEHPNADADVDVLENIIEFLFYHLGVQLGRPVTATESSKVAGLWIKKSEDGDLRELLAAHSWILDALKVHFASLGLKVKALLDDRDLVFAELVIINAVLNRVIRKVVKDRNVQKEFDEEKAHQDIWVDLIKKGAEQQNKFLELQEKADTATKEQCAIVLVPMKNIQNCKYMGSIKSLLVRIGSLLDAPAASGAAAAAAASSTGKARVEDAAAATAASSNGKARAEEIAAATAAKTAAPAALTRGLSPSGCSSKGKARASTDKPEGDGGGASKRQRLERNVGPAPEATGNADAKADFIKALAEMKTAFNVAYNREVDGETIGKWQEVYGILDNFLFQFGSFLPNHTGFLDKKGRVLCLIEFLRTIEAKDKAFHAHAAKKGFVQSAINLLSIHEITFNQFQGKLMAFEHACDSVAASSQ